MEELIAVEAGNIDERTYTMKTFVGYKFLWISWSLPNKIILKT